MFLRLNKQFPQKIAVKVAYDNAVAHKIEAGSDMFLMPSRYEPCGLNQIYSLKYGTVPLCAQLAGSMTRSNRGTPARGREPASNSRSTAASLLLLTIKEALRAFRDQASWQVLMRNGMSKDFSWSNSAKEYVRIYERVARQSRAGSAS